MYRSLVMATGILIGIAPDEALVKKLSTPMWSVAKLVTLETWNPRIDELIRRFPGAEPLGAKWNSSAPAWQKARTAVSSRVMKVIDAYSKYPEFTETLREQLDKSFPGAKAAELAKMLDGPAGPALIMFQARQEFLLEMMSLSVDPNAPSPGDPAWPKAVASLSQKFKDGIGPGVPSVDATYEKDVIKFSDEPLGREFSMLWMSVVGKAKISIEGGISLIIFDDREAITREINQAIASMK
jgi:hypothetical protein